MSKSFYVYRFKNSLDQVIYVGKTKEELRNRFMQHRHLPDSCYNSVYKIEYIICKTESDMAIKEIYYINKYCHEGHTTYNIADATAPTIEIELEDEWILYNDKLPKWFSSSINANKRYRDKKKIRYTKDGSIKKTTPHRKSGYNYDVYPLSDEEVFKLERCFVRSYQNATNGEDKKIRFRNLLIFMTGIQYPVKISVLLNLKYKDLFDTNDMIKPLKYQTKRIFKDYIFTFHLDDSLILLYQLYREVYDLTYSKNCDDYLFFSREGGAISSTSFNALLKKIVKESGIEKNAGGETLRKTYGLHIFNSCDDKIRALDYLEIIFGSKGYGEVGKYLCILSKDFDYNSFLTNEFNYRDNKKVYSEMLMDSRMYNLVNKD